MKRYFGHILIVIMTALLCLSSCSKDEEQVIPRDTMAQIYAEMLVTDQWILSTPNVRKIADTSLVYEPILEKYGFDSDDYRRSVDVYMDDPERFARIFRETSEILTAKLKDLNIKKEEQEKEKARRKELEKFKPGLKNDDFYPYLFKEPYVHYYDSVSFELDSVKQIYSLISIERVDTVYDNLKMIILKTDTLDVSDCLPVADSLMRSDSLMKEDTVQSFVKQAVDMKKKFQLIR